VARNLLKAIQRERVVAPVSPEAWIMYYLGRLAPWLLRRLNATLAERDRKRLGLG
jgi:hypothetical protein